MTVTDVPSADLFGMASSVVGQRVSVLVEIMGRIQQLPFDIAQLEYSRVDQTGQPPDPNCSSSSFVLYLNLYAAVTALFKASAGQDGSVPNYSYDKQTVSISRRRHL
jgi:hypothetical protein